MGALRVYELDQISFDSTQPYLGKTDNVVWSLNGDGLLLARGAATAYHNKP